MMRPMSDRRSGSFAADLATIPNIVTLSRIFLVLVGAGLFFAGKPGLGILIAVLAGITDYLDGYLARRLKQVTRLGEILDQFCDIFFESVVVTVMAAHFHYLPLWFLTLYLVREFWITSIRRFMAGYQLNISSNLVGKLKSNFLLWGSFPGFLSIEGLLPGLEPWVRYLGQFGMGVGLVFGYLSGWNYTRQMVAGYNQISSRADG
jgi:CDP-diacylglycerol--glycerol-3-phosphate 3-phosphatidyltransferase